MDQWQSPIKKGSSIWSEKLGFLLVNTNLYLFGVYNDLTPRNITDHHWNDDGNEENHPQMAASFSYFQLSELL